MANPVAWFQILGQDSESLVSFYERTLGWKTGPMPGLPGSYFVEKAEDGIPGGIASAPDGSENGVSIYIGVDSIEDAAEQIEANGGCMVMQKTDLPNNMGAIASFTDPAGNTVGLWVSATPPKGGKKTGGKKKGGKKKTGGKKTGGKKGGKKTGGKKTGGKKKGGKKTGGKKTGGKKTGGKKTGGKKTGGKKTGGKKTGGKKTGGKKTGGKKTGGKKTGGKKTGGKKTGGKKSGGKKRNAA